MGLQDRVEKMQQRQNYRNIWHTDLMRATQADIPYCCFAVWCGPCVSYLLRRRALYNDMSRYVCCGGFLPCSGKCGEKHCPQFCLATEVFCCFGSSVASTRFMLQDEFNIQTSKCDNCIIGFMFCLQQIACIFSLIACIIGSEEIEEASQLLSCLADMVYCSVCACMQTQHKVEMDKRDGKFGPQPAMAVPPVQQMSRVDQPYPPPGHGQPPPSYGHPPQGHVQSPPSYGHPPPGHGQPPPSYSLPLPEHGQSPPSYGHPPPGHGQPPPSYGQPPPGHGQLPHSYGQPPSGHGQPPPFSYGQPPPGHGQPPPSSGQSPVHEQPPPSYPPSSSPNSYPFSNYPTPRYQK